MGNRTIGMVYSLARNMHFSNVRTQPVTFESKVLSFFAEKAFGKIQHPFMIKNPSESEHRGNIPQHNKTHIW